MFGSEKGRLDILYRCLCRMFPHPHDWMYGLERPAFWRIKQKRGHALIKSMFRVQGFELTPEVAARFGKNPDAFETYGLDAGGTIICDLAYALEGQLEGSWRDFLPYTEDKDDD